jgi:methenyltetrahydrofolate cyclohydrolase
LIDSSSTPLQQLAILPLSSLFAAAASPSPTPGGGTITAIGGYLGVSLLLKSIRVSARKQPSEIYTRLEENLLELASRLLTAAQADSAAFEQYMSATKMPKATSAEQAARQQAMQASSIAATNSALDILDLGNAVLDCAHQLQLHVLPAVQPDARAAIELASAMNRNARDNAFTNLAPLGAAAGVEELRPRLDRAFGRYRQLLAACHRSE